MYYAVLNKQVLTFFDDRFIWGEVLTGLSDSKPYEAKPSIDWARKSSKIEDQQKVQKLMKRENQSDDQDEGRVEL